MAKSIRPLKVPIRVLIATADNMTGELLTGAFSRVRKDYAFATATSSLEAIRALTSYNPHVALISGDLQDGPRAGFTVLQTLRESRHNAAAIMLLQAPDSASVVSAFRAGARGVFYRSHPLKALSKCIRVVHRGQIWASTEDIKHVLGALVNLTPLQFLDKNGKPKLTRREEDVVRLVAAGLKNRELAEKLGIAEHTIRNYLSRIFKKLGVTTRIELVLYAFSQRQLNN